MEKEKIEVTVGTKFHMVRHFTEISSNYISDLTHNGYNLENISGQLKLPSSRFYPEFANSIDEIINKLYLFGFSTHQSINGNNVLLCSVPSSKYSNGIGTNVVIEKRFLQNSHLSSLYLENNRGYPIHHLKLTSLPSTNKFYVILKPIATSNILITAFPGTFALPIPDKSMNKIVYKKCKLFWDQHVMLV